MSCSSLPYSHLYINSKDRVNYEVSTPSQFTINLAKPITPKKAKLVMCQIPNTFYNITSANNTLMAGTGSSANTTYSVTPGAYTLNDLINSLQQILAPLGTVNISYNNILGQVTIANSVNFSLNFNVAGTIAQVLGFGLGAYSNQTSFTATNPPRIYSSALFITFNLGSSIQTTTPNRSTYSFVIPNTCNKGEIIQFYALTQFDLQPRVADNSVGNLTFTAYDENGNQLQGMGDWSMILQVV